MENIHLKKIALVHDYLLRIGGAERVLKVFHQMFPQAPIYTIVYDAKFTSSFIPEAKIFASFLQKLPSFLRHRYKFFSLIIPSAVEQLDLSQYDIIVSSCSAFSKGVITKPEAIHICYCHTPTRFLWDWTHEYAGLLSMPGILKGFGKIILHFLRLWDQQAAKRVDYFIANSQHVAARIRKYYRRRAMVIYPPATMLLETCGRLPTKISLADRSLARADYFLIVSQLRPYKKIDIAIEAFKKLGFELLIIGEGSDKKRLTQLARGFANIKFIGAKTDEVVVWYYKNCRAFVFPGEEDFGIAMVEAMSFGKPILALRAGGAKEIVIEGISGEFFDEAHPVVLADGVRRLLQAYGSYKTAAIKQRAEEFSQNRFRNAILAFISEIHQQSQSLALRKLRGNMKQ